MEMTYEKAIKKLEEIVAKLEDGSATLEESMELFEEGSKLAFFCNEMLNTTEQKFTQLVNKINGSESVE